MDHEATGRVPDGPTRRRLIAVIATTAMVVAALTGILLVMVGLAGAFAEPPASPDASIGEFVGYEIGKSYGLPIAALGAVMLVVVLVVAMKRQRARQCK